MSAPDCRRPGSLGAELLAERYLLRDREGLPCEDFDGMVRRVAGHVAARGEPLASGDAARMRLSDEYAEILGSLRFLPNSPTLMNAGTPIGQLSACFVLPIEDSLDSIFQAVKDMALIHRTGGGTGFSFSRLRPCGDIVETTGSPASGPISFMEIFDAATSVVRQGGRRRGANMAVMSVHHPDIADFIFAKSAAGRLENFNISVAATDEFMGAARDGIDYRLLDPGSGEVRGTASARGMLNLILANAWKSGEPGLVFIDEVNRHNPTPALGGIESTNPCGEQPLLPYESCNLGSIDISRHLDGGRIDEGRLAGTVRLAVRFLDDVIEANLYRDERIRKVTKGNRKIGLGVMGFADVLISMGVRYDSEAGLSAARQLMETISGLAREESARLAAERGHFPNFPGSTWERAGSPPLRNATLTTIAPTGSLSILAGCSSGIEPLFGLAYTRREEDGSGTELLDRNFRESGEAAGWLNDAVLDRVRLTGSLAGCEGVPAEARELFRVAHDIEPEWHVRMQAAFQSATDNAVSKTVNLPAEAGPEDVEKAFMLAWELGCKGMTVYRSGSRPGQVMSHGAALRRFAAVPGADDAGPTGLVCTEPHCG